MVDNHHPHRRRSIRPDGYDYRQEGMYLVTICTHERRCSLGHMVEAVVWLSRIGQIATACWDAIPQHFPFVELDMFAVMPNHMHGIIAIGEHSGNVNVGACHAMPLRKTNVSG